MSNLELSCTDQIGRIALDASPGNTLTIEFMRKISNACREFAENKECRGIVLESKIPDVFSLGIDPDEIISRDMKGRAEVFQTLVSAIRAFLETDLPILAKVNGPAFAGGAVLVALADFAAIHHTKGKICFSEVKVNLPLPLFVQQLILRRTTPQHFRDIAFLGRNLNPEQAVATGFCQMTYQDDGEEFIQNYMNKIKRLDRNVLGTCLRIERQNFLKYDSDFTVDEQDFTTFLSDDYLGEALSSLK